REEAGSGTPLARDGEELRTIYRDARISASAHARRLDATGLDFYAHAAIAASTNTRCLNATGFYLNGDAAICARDNGVNAIERFVTHGVCAESHAAVGGAPYRVRLDAARLHFDAHAAIGASAHRGRLDAACRDLDRN